MKNLFNDKIKKELMDLKEQGLSYSDISDRILSKFGIDFSSKQLANKVYTETKKGIVYSDIEVDADIESIKINRPSSSGALSDEEAKCINDGYKVKEIKNSIDSNGNSVHNIIRRPLTSEEKSSKENVLIALGFNPKNTELTSFDESFWDQNTKAYGVIQLSSIKYSVKYKSGFAYGSDDLHKFINSVKSNKSLYKSIQVQKNIDNSDKLLLIPIADLHYGLYSTVSATSNKYSMDISEDRFFKIIDESIERCKKETLSKIVLVLGNDFFNADTLSGTTVKGTPQDQENGGLKKIYERGVSMVIKGIEKLSAVAPVLVMSVLSNHDEFSAWAMMVTLDKLYNDRDWKSSNRVEVIYGETPRTYLTYGSNLLGFSHHADVKDVYHFMSIENSDGWSRAKNKYFFLAHYHKEITVEDKFGLCVFRLPTISGKSKWSIGQGYVGTVETNKSFLFSPITGIESIFYIKP